MIWLLPPPTLFHHQINSLSQSSCLSLDEHNEGRGVKGRGKEPNHRRRENLALYNPLNTLCISWTATQQTGIVPDTQWKLRYPSRLSGAHSTCSTVKDFFTIHLHLGLQISGPFNSCCDSFNCIRRTSSSSHSISVAAEDVLETAVALQFKSCELPVAAVALPAAAMALSEAAEDRQLFKFWKFNNANKKYQRAHLPYSVQVLPVDRSGQVDGGPGLLLKVVNRDIPILAAG
jgi:hypothetical protein